MFYYGVLPDKRETYLQYLKSGYKTLNAQSGRFLEDFLSVTPEQRQYGYVLREKEIKRICELEEASLEDVFPAEIYPALDLLLGRFHRTLLIESCKKLPCFPYMTNDCRTMIRSLDYRRHIQEVWDIFTSMLNESVAGFEPIKFLKGEVKIDCYSRLMPRFYLFVEIDGGNRELIDCLKEMLLEQDKHEQLTGELFRAIVCSDNTELLKLTANLLISPGVEERIRREICEAMGRGTRENFDFLFRFVHRYDLIQFSFVQCALALWTGIGEEYAERLGQKEADYILKMIEKPISVDEAIAGKDKMQVFLGLWRQGSKDISEVKRSIDKIVKGAGRDTKPVLSYYLKTIQEKCDFSAAACEVILQYPNDAEILSCYHEILFGQDTGYYFKMTLDEFEKGDRSLLSYFKDGKEAKRILEIYLDMIDSMVDKVLRFSPCIFKWHSSSLTKESLVHSILLIGLMLGMDDWSFVMPHFKHVQGYARGKALELVFGKPKSKKEEKFIISMMSDRTSGGESARKIAKENRFADRYPREIESLLRFKNPDLRSDIISILYLQRKEDMKSSIERLIYSCNEDKRLAGLELILRGKEEGKIGVSWMKKVLEMIETPTSSEVFLIRRLLEEKTGRELETMLYDSDYIPQCKIEVKEKNGEKRKKAAAKLLGKKKREGYIIENSVSVAEIFSNTPEELFEILKKLIRLYESCGDYRYKDHTNQELLLCDRFVREVPKFGYQTEERLEDYPLADLWREFYRTCIKEFKVLYQLDALLGTDDEAYRSRYTHYKPVADRMFGYDVFELKERLKRYSGDENYENTKPYSYLSTIVHLLMNEYKGEYKQQRFEWAKAVISHLWLHEQPKDLLRESDYEWRYENSSYSILREFPFYISVLNDLSFTCVNEEQFAQSYLLTYHLHKRLSEVALQNDSSLSETWLGITDVAGAVQLGLVAKDEFYIFVLRSSSPSGFIGFISDCLNERWIKQNIKDEAMIPSYRFIQTEGGKMIRFIVESELSRVESPLAYSSCISSIKRVEGAELFMKVLAALGEGSFDCKIDQGEDTDSKRSTLSHILKVSYPKGEETAKDFGENVKRFNISTKSLIKAVICAPQWISLVEGYLGWKGMESACCCFRAHMGEVSVKDAKITAKYSSVSVEEFKEGAFDPDWFGSVYRTLGKKKFDLICECVKDIFRDRVSSRVDISGIVYRTTKLREIQRKMEEHRRIEAVMSYGLIPIGKNKKKEIIRRYKFLQTFLNENKNFGAKKRENESGAVAIALGNLSRNAGYCDVVHVLWMAESELFKEIEPLFEPKTVGELQVYLQVDEVGHSEVCYQKQGRRLKHLPVKYEKNSYIIRLRSVDKKLKEQWKHSVEALERLMENAEPFYGQEIKDMMSHIMLASLFDNIVMRSGDFFGYYRDGVLVDCEGREKTIEGDDTLVVAHPLDLYAGGKLEDYKADLRNRKIEQPFCQVFRELYSKTAEERGRDVSLRYAGQTIRSDKLEECLKKRHWLVDGEESLLKVYYRQNIVSELFVSEDRFSSQGSDSILGELRFFDRKTGSVIGIDEVPESVFSEAVRDVDLAIRCSNLE